MTMKELRQLTIAILCLLTLQAQSQDSSLIVTLDMKEDVSPALWRKTQKAFEFAHKNKADKIIIHMNTYGGMVVSADSIRTKILNAKIPVWVFIDNNAASAGALISVACDKIYMRKGANIGAATVVNQTGQQMPDKYQSYMRSTMRATAEAHGKDTIINGNDTTYKWIRDPAIAEAMVDADVFISGISDSGKVVTFTTLEAQQYGFCDGTAEDLQEILQKEGLSHAVLKPYKPSGLDNLIGLLMSPALQGILIMIIFGGLYFELQSPGIGFPLAAAVLAAIIYFSPLYLEGLAANWEIALFMVGIILIGVELFAIPGFGVAGISGITLAIVGLTLAMVDSFEFTADGIGWVAESFFKALLLVLASLAVSFIASLYVGKKIFESSFLGSKLALQTTQQTAEGYLGVDSHLKDMVGKTGVAQTILRPSGTVMIENEAYDAKAEYGYIEANTPIKVSRSSASQLYVVPKKDKEI